MITILNAKLHETSTRSYSISDGVPHQRPFSYQDFLVNRKREVDGFSDGVISPDCPTKHYYYYRAY